MAAPGGGCNCPAAPRRGEEILLGVPSWKEIRLVLLPASRAIISSSTSRGLDPEVGKQERKGKRRC